MLAKPREFMAGAFPVYNDRRRVILSQLIVPAGLPPEGSSLRNEISVN
jgi:hypothetical protein